MGRVAVVGAGAGGLSTLVELAQAGHEVALWGRATTLAAYPGGLVRYSGVLGHGSVKAELATADLAAALEGAGTVVVSLPGPAHAALFAELAGTATGAAPLVLSPGQTGGALHLRHVFARHGTPLPPVAEFSTLPYVARARPGEGEVSVSGQARHLRCGTLPGGAEAAKAAGQLFASALEVTDVLASSLSNVNLVLHPPGALLSAAWAEATSGDFTFYGEAMTPGVARVLEALDGERRAVAARFGHRLPSLVEEMALVGTVTVEAGKNGSTAEAIRSGEANRTIRAPSSLAHRYYTEDFAFGLVPFLALAAVAGTATPVATGLVAVAQALLGPGAMAQGLGADAMGIAGLDAEGLLRLVRE